MFIKTSSQKHFNTKQKMIKFLNYSKTNFKEKHTKEILKKKSKSVVVQLTRLKKKRKTELKLRSVRQNSFKRNKLLKD